jgi:environmental stress-induced protein Ves
MKNKIFTSEHFKPVSWSGGTTTELYIFPQSADYLQRNFLFRLSTATVETERSDFTKLPGTSRKLMVLCGKITLNHDSRYSRQLNKFDIDEFEGDWITSSVGQGTDFNLMTTGKTTGKISAAVIEKDKYVKCNIKGNCDWFFIYLYSGKASIEINNKITSLNKGDLFVLNELSTRDFEIKGIENSELVFTEITL